MGCTQSKNKAARSRDDDSHLTALGVEVNHDRSRIWINGREVEGDKGKFIANCHIIGSTTEHLGFPPETNMEEAINRLGDGKRRRVTAPLLPDCRELHQQLCSEHKGYRPTKHDLVQEAATWLGLDAAAANHWLKEKQSKLEPVWKNSVEPLPKVAISAYVGTAHRFVNAAQRAGEGHCAATITYIVDGIRQIPVDRPGKRIVVYRCQTALFGQQFNVGEIVTIPSFFSTTEHPHVAKLFGTEVTFTIKLPAKLRERKVAYLDELAKADCRGAEDEHLVRPAAQFKVTKNKANRDIGLTLIGFADTAQDLRDTPESAVTIHPSTTNTASEEKVCPICAISYAIEHPDANRKTADANVEALLTKHAVLLGGIGGHEWACGTPGTPESVPWINKALQNGWPATARWIARHHPGAWHSSAAIEALNSCPSQEGFEEGLDALLDCPSGHDLPHTVFELIFASHSFTSAVPLFARVTKCRLDKLLHHGPGLHHHPHVQDARRRHAEETASPVNTGTAIGMRGS